MNDGCRDYHRNRCAWAINFIASVWILHETHERVSIFARLMCTLSLASSSHERHLCCVFAVRPVWKWNTFMYIKCNWIFSPRMCVYYECPAMKIYLSASNVGSKQSASHLVIEWKICENRWYSANGVYSMCEKAIHLFSDDFPINVFQHNFPIASNSRGFSLMKLIGFSLGMHASKYASIGPMGAMKSKEKKIEKIFLRKSLTPKCSKPFDPACVCKLQSMRLKIASSENWIHRLGKQRHVAIHTTTFSVNLCDDDIWWATHQLTTQFSSIALTNPRSQLSVGHFSTWKKCK